jgi:hypothetical protein
MYGALWRILPGPWWLRALILVVLAAALLYGLAFWVFPWINGLIPQADVTVEGQP